MYMYYNLKKKTKNPKYPNIANTNDSYVILFNKG